MPEAPLVNFASFAPRFQSFSNVFIGSVPEAPFVNFASFLVVSVAVVAHAVWLLERGVNTAQFRAGYFEVALALTTRLFMPCFVHTYI